MPPCRCMGQSRIMGEPLHSALSVCRSVAAIVQHSMRASAVTCSLRWLLRAAHFACCLCFATGLARQVVFQLMRIDKLCSTNDVSQKASNTADAKHLWPHGRHKIARTDIQAAGDTMLQQAQTPHVRSLPPSAYLLVHFLGCRHSVTAGEAVHPCHCQRPVLMQHQGPASS